MDPLVGRPPNLAPQMRRVCSVARVNCLLIDILSLLILSVLSGVDFFALSVVSAVKIWNRVAAPLERQHGKAPSCHRYDRRGRHGPYHSFLLDFLPNQRGATHTVPRRVIRQVKRKGNDSSARCRPPVRRIDRWRHCAQAGECDSQVRPELLPAVALAILNRRVY